MALYYNLPVYKDTYQLIMLIYEVTRQFPREYKYSLGQDMKRDAMELVRSIYRANRSLEKKQFLENTYNIRKKMLRHFSAYWWNHIYIKKDYVALKYRRVNKIKQS